MSTSFGLSTDQFEALIQSMENYGAGALAMVDEVIHDSGPEIAENITPLIHPSGRRWRGKKDSAVAGAWPLYQTNTPLEITVTTKTKYGYLYFPDDGSNTRKHAGRQNFFGRGGERSIPKVIDKCQEALSRAWEES